MNKINKINVCCQKVLPLVYDESLSYYEVLCKVIQKLNELIKINNNIRDEVHSDYLAVLEGAKVATEAVASVTAMRDEVLTLKQATEQYAHDVTTVYNQTVEARDTAIAKANIAEQSATTATQKAEIASTSATTATEKANIAVQSATTATQKAEIASTSATTATEKAESAVQSANTATAKADIAVESANTATEKANIASTSATTATEKANIASTSADTAIAKAQEASASATTASNKADSAKHDANLSSTMAQNARASAEEAQTNADKALTAMSLVSGTVNYYKSDEISIMVEEDTTYAYTTPYIRNNVLYINVRLEYTLRGPLTIKLPNLTTKTINFTPVINWATGVIENIDLQNLPHTVFSGGGIPIIDGVQFITACVSSYRSFPIYKVGLQMFSNEKTQISLESGKSITIPYYFTLIQPLVFTDEVTPNPTDYITKLNEETQAREQADTQLQNNINTEKTARENADAQLQTNINTEKTARENADAKLQTNINTEKTARENADAQLKEDLSNKITKFYASNQGETNITDSDNGKIQDMMIYGKSEQKQYSGKNLLELSDNQVQSENLKIQINQGIITFSGTVNNQNFLKEIDSFTVPSDGTYTISTNSNSNKDSPRILITINDSQYLSALNGATKELNTADVVRLYIRISSVGSYDGVTIKPMIEKGSKVTSYEPYTGGQPSPSPNYPQEIQSVVNPKLSVSNGDGTLTQEATLPYTLNAIPIMSGGNVTIDGQQYVADYVDVEHGKLVKMVDSSKLDNTQSIVNKTEWLLAEPQETDLTTEQITAFKALATYYPTTNIIVNSKQLDGYTVFNYPISMANGWNYVKQQLNDNRDYIYDMDLQSAEAYVNSEYAVTLTELEV